MVRGLIGLRNRSPFHITRYHGIRFEVWDKDHITAGTNARHDPVAPERFSHLDSILHESPDDFMGVCVFEFSQLVDRTSGQPHVRLLDELRDAHPSIHRF